MDKLKVLIIDPDDHFSDLAGHFLAKFPDLELLTRERNGRDGLRRIRAELPDVVLFDLLLSELDGLSLLRQAMELSSPPSMICCTRFYSEVALEAIRTYGASLMLFKPVDLQSLRPAIVDCARLQRTVRQFRRSALEFDADGDRQIARIRNRLVALGVPSKLAGCNYLTEGVRLAISDVALTRNLSKGLYLEISRSMDTTPARVERCIRNAISVAYQSGGLEGKMLTCPSNKEFIHYVLHDLDIPSH